MVENKSKKSKFTVGKLILSILPEIVLKIIL